MFLIPIEWFLYSSADSWLYHLLNWCVTHRCINRKELYPALNFGRKSNSPLECELKLASALVGNMNTFLCLMQYHWTIFPGCYTMGFSLNYILHTKLWILVALKIGEKFFFYTFTNYCVHLIVGNLECAI